MNIINTMLNIYSGAKALATQHSIPVHTLKYIGCSDCAFINKGAVLLQYNVDVPGHPKHKSTISHKFGWIN